MRQRRLLLLLLPLVAVIAIVGLAVAPVAAQLPGMSARSYGDDEELDLKVNALTSSKTQLPYEYYTLPFCQPKEGISQASENLGELLFGDRIESSAYTLKMMQKKTCSILCDPTYNAEQMAAFAQRIQEEYRVNMLLDGLPASVLKGSGTYEIGFELGFLGDPELYPNTRANVPYIYNHLDFTVKYHTEPSFTGKRVVGFEIKPVSVKHEPDPEKPADPLHYTCPPVDRRVTDRQAVDSPGKIYWTYSVRFEESPVRWASRWDVYLLMEDDQVHWFSIINSLMIVLFLAGMVAMIMLRVLNRDLARYNENPQEADESGWKQVSRDVFRPPKHPNLFAVAVGSGVQVLSMAMITMVFASLGFLRPQFRGALMTAMVVLYVLMGAVAGYFSARFYKTFGGENWKRNCLATALAFPGVCFGVFVFLNFVMFMMGSSGAVPFGAMVGLIGMWFGISVPLVFVGAYFGFRKEAIQYPVKPRNFPGHVPPQPWYMQPMFTILVGGVFPFFAVFIELFFIMSSLWQQQFYYLFGFLFIVFFILIITCGEITIVLCYFQLCGGDHQWWWRSFLTSGSSALYLFLYSFVYFFTRLDIVAFVSGLLYFGYMLLISFFFFVLTGAIGFLACFFFLRAIYASIKHN